MSNILLRKKYSYLKNYNVENSLECWLSNYMIKNVDVDYFVFSQLILNSSNSLSVLYSHGQFDLLIKAINVLYKPLPEKVLNFINTHQIYRFKIIFDGVLKEIKEKYVYTIPGKIRLSSDDELIRFYKNTNPSKNLETYIDTYSEILNRSSSSDFYHILLEQQSLPLLNFFQLGFIKKHNKIEYLKVIISSNTTCGDYLFLNYISSNDFSYGVVECSNDILNKIYRLVMPENWHECLNKFKSNKEYLSLLGKAYLNEFNFSYPKDKKNGPFVICLSGQFRGGAECLDFWFDFADKYKCPLFLSTWEHVGGAKGSHGAKSSRMFSKKFQPFFSSFSTGEVLKNFEVNEDVFNEKVEPIWEKIKSKYPNVKAYIKIKSENSFCKGGIPEILLNQSKMFHNMEEVTSMLEHYESSKGVLFENIIWARPDLKVINFNPEVIFNNMLLTSFLGSGSSCGDLIFQFNRVFLKFMKGLRFCLNEDYKFFSGVGPKLLGNSALFNGLYIEKFTNNMLVEQGLKSPQISDDLVIKIASKYVGDNATLIDLKFVCKSIIDLQNNNFESAIENQNKIIGRYDFLADNFRDSALSMEKSNVPLALKLMEIALFLRPLGPLIKMKVNTYKNNC